MGNEQCDYHRFNEYTNRTSNDWKQACVGLENYVCCLVSGLSTLRQKSCLILSKAYGLPSSAFPSFLNAWRVRFGDGAMKSVFNAFDGSSCSRLLRWWLPRLPNASHFTSIGNWSLTLVQDVAWVMLSWSQWEQVMLSPISSLLGFPYPLS